VPCPRFQAKPVKKSLFQPTIDAPAQVINDVNLVGFEGAAQQSGKLALFLRLCQFLAGYADPSATARGLGKQIRRDASIGAEGKPDELGTSPMLT
jgi:hypothetical protein